MRKLFATRWPEHRSRSCVIGPWPAVAALALLLCVGGLEIRAWRVSVSRYQPVEPRRIVVLGDLHMGVGRESSGEWHPTEDFRWAEEFRLFLEALNDETDDATDLILNGDTFELSSLALDSCRR